MIQVAGGILLALVILALLPLILGSVGAILGVILPIMLVVVLWAVNPGLGLFALIGMWAWAVWTDR